MPQAIKHVRNLPQMRVPRAGSAEQVIDTRIRWMAVPGEYSVLIYRRLLLNLRGLLI